MPVEEMELEVLDSCTSVVLEVVSDVDEEVLLLLEKTPDELEITTPVLISTEEGVSMGAVSTVVELIEAG